MVETVKRAPGAAGIRAGESERGAPRSASLKARLLSQTAALALSSATAMMIAGSPAAHAQAVGDTITNPQTNTSETIVEVTPEGVITQSGLFILTTPGVGDFIPDPAGSGTAEVKTALTNATTGLVDRVELVDGRIVAIVQSLESTVAQVSPPVEPTPGAGDFNSIRLAPSGNRGSNGRGGAVFIPATSGGDGGSGPDMPRSGDPSSYALGGLAITTVTNGLAGVEWSSSGGNGGNGGGSTFNLAGGGKSGGKGGAGGDVTLVLNGGTIATSGEEAHGVVAQSRSGVGGQGGSSFLATGGGGSGGAGNDGGAVTLTVGADTNITTTNDGSVGVFAQSLGGGAGAGGSSYNLFAFGGGAKDGGDGGDVTLSFAGTARTQGLGAHGVFAQSLGGTGGQAGNAGGLLAFGDDGSGGGDGGAVALFLRSTAFVETDGFGSHGVFAQSVGGGGGASATSVGLAAFGAEGGSGGDGGSVNLVTEAGAQVTTLQGFSHGVFAQSVGGGGGSGGTTVGAVSLGAGGGGGGNAASVTVNSAADISTSGIMSRGIFAQSVGGGGGSANAAVGLIAIGGSSSDGGSAGDVTVEASGLIETDGGLSTGILAQSIGGGGGDGGMAISGSAFAGLAIGGQGGGGGDSGVVTLRMRDRTVITGGVPTQVDPAISTMGALARGIHLQSVGGGGGNGGLAVQASVGAFGAASFAIGGDAGAGGDGGLVRMFGDVNVQTEGFGSEGIVLQSVGGGGGSGGGAVSVAVSGGIGFSGSFSLALGGSGGQGGDSLGEFLNANGDVVASGGTRSAVFMDSGGFIGTDGQFSTGLFVQSIGGGGGNGGFSVAAPLAFSDTVALSVGVGVGGGGGDGGDGGRVDATFDGAIVTRSDDSLGALIQSTGGGGGNGGFNVTASLAGAGVVGGAVAVGVGGAGGGGGEGGEVTGRVLGAVTTEGDRSSGVVVQSTGGGGGNGGFNVSGSIGAAGTVGAGVSVGVGGSGGGGGDGGNVTATADRVTTSGEASDGFLAQSVGGGGGNGVFNVSLGIGASGTASGAVTVGVGGSGGGGGRGGAVDARLQGDVSTSGLNSDGVTAQSLGGGGGAGAFNVSAGIAASSVGSGTVGIGVGGSGGVGGDGGAVTLALQGDQVDEFISVFTGGDASAFAESDAIVAQSVGGGGGNGGFNITGGIAVGGNASGNIGVGVGGSGGGGGDGGQVILNANTGFDLLDGMLAQTTGDRSRGVIAQSVGGGGGAGAFNVTGGLAVTYSGGFSGNLGVGVGGAGGDGGDGRAVSADLTGGVLTQGANSGGVEVSSLGGGGGSGAFNITGGVAITASSGVSGNIGIGVGGSGGGGGDGARVDALVNSAIDTFGADSDGAVFQSVGGGGGAGGFNVTGNIGVTAGSGVTGNIGVGIGGSGGSGGDGGAVDAGLTGLVLTREAGSDGVIAQSLGGGGGSGGFNVTGNIGITAGSGLAGSIGVGIGGKGGLGGDSGAVTLSVIKGTGLEAARGAADELAVVTTLEDRAKGVVAQSLGGSGGSGGFNVTGDINVTAGSGASGAIGVGVGGFGGGGGDAGDVGLTLVGDVHTGGEASSAIEATSSGGGGGAGAFNITGGVAVTTGSGATGNIGVGVGGFGGDGGNAGAVTADVRSDVITLGDDAAGALFQSTGGGGGGGAFNVTGGVSINAGSGIGGTVGVGIGGFGGEGGNAGAVDVSFDGVVRTSGVDATAVTAQSVGGSGGNGAFNITGGVAVSKSAAGTIGVGLGGYGGGGGDAGDVAFRMNQRDAAGAVAIQTTGEGARGGVVQSLGGGGGSGAFNITGGLSFSKSGAGNIGVGIGGSGGDGGAAGSASAFVNGGIFTGDDEADAFLLQSVGGGGGNGAFNVTGGISGSKGPTGNLLVGVGGAGGGGGDGGAVVGVFNSSVTTLGQNAYGLTAQSNGGAGGNGAFNITGGISVSGSGSGAGAGVLGVGVGGAGGDGGDGGAVDVSLDGDISTRGAASHGALVQSQGGGGGRGGFNITGGVSVANSNSATIGVGVGGFGGGGGNSGTVLADFDGDVTTLGADSFGLALQSIGGGGGAGAFNVTGGLTLAARSGNSASISVGIGGFGGDGGQSGAVTGSVTGTYATQGADSTGVLAQSLAGGGGNGGVNVSGAVALSSKAAGVVSVGVGGFGGGGGQSAAVDLRRVGDTATSGARSDAILAQSIGGGGGNGGVNVAGGLSGSTSGNTGGLVLGVGGFGGSGGDAGAVTAHATGNVIATGLAEDIARDTFGVTIPGAADPQEIVVERQRIGGSHGLAAQSLGGGGGNGGVNVSGQFAVTGSQGSGRAVTLGVGGFGGGAGNGADVSVTLDAPGADRVQAAAIGDGKSAVLAQSVGGGGGSGGVNITGGMAVTGQVALGIGGFGGGGGLGGDVSAAVDADLFASGRFARGLFAQSVGGGGGDGAINITGGVTAGTGTTGPSLSFGMGGQGGAGNRSGAVTVTQSGLIRVDGIDATGLLAQSVAGGGGAGGLNVTANISAAKAGQSALAGFGAAVGIGGDGGDGADADSVSVSSVGDILMNLAAVPNAGAGDDPFEGVAFMHSAPGLIAQSVGGGGGVGGVNVAAAISPQGSPVVVGVGGTGGSGGASGDVTVNRGWTLDGSGARVDQAGLIRTSGDFSTGLSAQSIAGGGGRGGVNVTGALSLGGPSNAKTYAAQFGIGGGGGDASDAGDVTVDHVGAIMTDGDASDGLFAQSVGGGGGSANYNLGLGFVKDASAVNFTIGGATGIGGAAGGVTVDHIGDIATLGADSAAIRAQSIGGGGGNAAFDQNLGFGSENALDIGIGRRGGEGGEGGAVSVTSTGQLDTSGDRSSGVYAQSVGGGGGGSSATSVGLSVATGEGSNAKSLSGSVSIGLEGGEGAVGGDVNVDTSGRIVTSGRESAGVFAHSIGGGGGTGGTASSLLLGDDLAASVAVGGAGGVGARAGDVTVANQATIITEGDRSEGIFAQSASGGGGLGGFTYLLGIDNPLLGSDHSVSAVVSVGGTGGEGAVGGAVDVTQSAVISTLGEESHAVRAQSVGGGGGVGGAVVALRAQIGTESKSADINIGGAGGTGAGGGGVDITNTGMLFTEGRAAHGVYAQSIGGGGGDAGLILSLQTGSAGASGSSHRAVTNIGGSGGTGGAGGDVSVSNLIRDGEDGSGQIVTAGEGAHGVFAQSLGGGGGNGGSIVQGALFSPTANTVTVGLNIGGAGGSGVGGGSVDVVNEGLIDTSGDGAHGVYAQSIGGGGGNGGLALAVSTAVFAEVGAPLIAIGGVGGDGGDGGDVSVTNSGRIVTRGARAHGVLAQSIGGGGGNANLGVAAGTTIASNVLSSALSALVGSTGGGAGGAGGAVSVIHTGDITVLGDGAEAIKAESINGGGGGLVFDMEGVLGLTGVADPVTGTVAPDAAPEVSFTLGAEGAQSMNAGQVTVTSTGTIGAAGDHGAAIANSAIGGGGGSLDLVVDFSEPAAGDLGVQSAGGTQGLKRAATDFNTRFGERDGVDNGGAAIDSVHTGAAMTEGLNSPAVLIQSVGGGGGRGVMSLTGPSGALGDVSLNLGSINSTGGLGGDVTRSQTGAAATLGDFSNAVVVQSLGGGGGRAGLFLDGDGADQAAVSLGLGADGGSGLDAGAVTGAFSGGLSTAGADATALLVQSIGAGGGQITVSGADAPEIAVGGGSGAAGDGGAISLDHSGRIETGGARSHGVLLQSIGGGGGAVFGALDGATLALSGANTGDGGAVSFDQAGDIVAMGAGSYGLIVQSLGGGGGWVDGAVSAGGAGAGGAIAIDVDGAIFTPGMNSTAVFAQSQGADGAGDILARITGLVRGGGGTGAGVVFEGGAANTLNAFGSVSAISGLAMSAGAGDDTVNNYGLVAGDIDLGAGANRFNNQEGATFVAFSEIDLRDEAGAAGAASAFESGLASEDADRGPDMDHAGVSRQAVAPDGGPTAGPSGAAAPVMRSAGEAIALAASPTAASSTAAIPVTGAAATFTNAGDFLMGLSAPRFPLDLANGDTFANLDGEGDPATNFLLGARVINTVALDGNFAQTEAGHMAFDVAFGPYGSDVVNVTGDTTVDGTGEVILTWLESDENITLFATDGTAVDNGLEIADTMAIDFGIEANDAGIQLTLLSDFGLDFLTRNGQALGGHLDSAIRADDSAGIGRLAALLGNLQAGQEDVYAEIFTEIDPSGHLAPLQAQLDNAQGFAGELFSCESPVRRVDGQCVWTRLEVSTSLRDGTAEEFEVDSNAIHFRGGFEQEMDELWTVAAAIGYDTLSGFRVDGTRMRTDGQALHAGLGFERTSPSGVIVGGGATLGWQWTDSVRRQTVFVPGFGESSANSGYLTTELHLAQVFRSGRVFARPELSASATALHHTGFTETGLDGLGFEGLSDTQVIARFSPELAVGAVLHEGPASSATFTVTLGAELQSRDRVDLPLRFLGANPDADPAMIGTTLDQESYRISTDLHLVGSDRIGLRFGYTGEFGDAVQDHRAGFDFRVKF